VKECFNIVMLKAKAIELLGGTTALAAEAIGITPQAISQWPNELPARIADRVYAALARRPPAQYHPTTPAPDQSAGQGV
jgi:hypothetical protein